MAPDVSLTARELCLAWEGSLPSRSYSDTEQTRAEIGRGYDVAAAACGAIGLEVAAP